MASNESGVVEAIRKRIAAEWPSSVTWKMHGSIYMETGIPDIMCCVEGRLIALEVKHRKPSESESHAYSRTSVEQVRQIRRIRAAGGAACTVLDEGGAVRAVREALTGSTLASMYPRTGEAGETLKEGETDGEGQASR
nr:MAG TPA: Nuclease [Caudoviricetes sp.]